MNPKKIEACCRAAHEVNRAYCVGIGDTSQLPWDNAPEWQRTSCLNGVKLVLDGAGPREAHDSWLAEKEATGWKHGPVKDETRKEHPCMVPYDRLPDAQRRKDSLFVNVVRMVATALDMWPHP